MAPKGARRLKACTLDFMTGRRDNRCNLQINRKLLVRSPERPLPICVIKYKKWGKCCGPKVQQQLFRNLIFAACFFASARCYECEFQQCKSYEQSKGSDCDFVVLERVFGKRNHGPIIFAQNGATTCIVLSFWISSKICCLYCCSNWRFLQLKQLQYAGWAKTGIEKMIWPGLN